MKIVVMAAGKVKKEYLVNALSDFEKRLRKYVNITLIDIKDEKIDTDNKQLERILQTEAERFLRQIEPDDFVVCLDRKGKSYDSHEFAEFINNKMNEGLSRLVFVIGGANGIGESLLKRANLSLSFSKLTFPHELFKIMLMEQIYRCFKIIKNEPYHR